MLVKICPQCYDFNYCFVEGSRIVSKEILYSRSQVLLVGPCFLS